MGMQEELMRYAQHLAEKEETEKIALVKRFILSNSGAKEVALGVLEALGYEVSINKRIEPRKCRYCGSKALIERDHLLNLNSVVCEGCGMSSPQRVSKDDAISLWNELDFYPE